MAYKPLLARLPPSTFSLSVHYYVSATCLVRNFVISLWGPAAQGTALDAEWELKSYVSEWMCTHIHMHNIHTHTLELVHPSQYPAALDYMLYKMYIHNSMLIFLAAAFYTQLPSTSVCFAVSVCVSVCLSVCLSVFMALFVLLIESYEFNIIFIALESKAWHARNTNNKLHL